ncbi:MAG: hypothetical protein WCL06_11700 [Bacteroidota bacterium]
MKKTLTLCLFVMVCLSAQTFAQKESTDYRLMLRDGNVISGTSQIDNISLVTKWGKLDIPLKDISELQLGVTPETSSKDKIKALVIDLNNATLDIRKKAYESLITLNMGCIPVLEDYINSSEFSASLNDDYNASMALKELKSLYNYTDDTQNEDIVVTGDGYRIGGSINLKNISLKTAYGSLEIPRAKIKSMEIFYKSNDGSESTYILNANKHISGNTNGGYLKTGIYVKSGQHFTITASGEVTLASLSGYKYKPGGQSSAAGVTSDYGDEDYSGSASAYPTYGNLVFKIGENGIMTKAGASYKGTATASGYLYLSIYETVYNAANTGSYTVKIKAN